MAKVNTVNVVSIYDGELLVRSYTNDEQGITEAEEFFTRLIKEASEKDDEPMTDEQIQDAIMDGYYQSYNVELFITHSN